MTRSRVQQLVTPLAIAEEKEGVLRKDTLLVYGVS